MVVSFTSAGTKAATTTSAISVPLPTTPAPSQNNILLLSATTIAGGTVTITATGGMTWNAVTGSPIDVTAGDKLYVWWARFNTGNTAPSVQATTDHVCAGIACYSGCPSFTSPINVQNTGTETTSDTTLSFATGISTTRDACKVILASSSGTDSNTAQHSSQANTSLTSIAERIDFETSQGGGGGFQLVEGTLTTAGSCGTWTTTLATASPKAYICFALMPYTSATKTYTVNAELNASFTKAFTAASELLYSGSKTFTAAAELAAGVVTYTKTFSANTELSKTQLKTFSAAADLLHEGFCDCLTLNAELLQQQTTAFTIAAELQAPVVTYTKELTFNTELVKEQTKEFSVNSELQVNGEKTFTFDAELLYDPEVGFTVGAELETLTEPTYYDLSPPPQQRVRRVNRKREIEQLTYLLAELLLLKERARRRRN